jgi:hypothetical protein
MAISIVKQPNKVSWSRNPIVFEFHTDQVILEAGRPLIFTLDFSQVDNVVDSELHTPEKTYYYYLDWSFTLIVKQTKFLFSCEYASPINKFKIPHRIGPTETKQDWVVKVKNAILNAFNLSSLFVGEVDGQKIKFSSIENDVSLDVQIQDVTNDLAVAIETPQTPVSKNYTPNLKIFVELIAIDLSLAERSVVSAALVPDINGNASWDFSKPLSSLCLSDGPDILSVEDVGIVKSKCIKQFYLRATELSGEPQGPRTSVVTDLFFAVYGGLPKNLQNLSFGESISVNESVRFLCTTQDKKVIPDQPNWLSWFNLNETYTEVKVEVEVVYSDGMPFSFTAYSIVEIKQFEKVIIPVGLVQINANTYYPELDIVSYKVWLHAEGKKISNIIRFFVDDTLHQYQRVFLFQNSLGSPETLFTSGKKAISYEIEKSNAIISQAGTFDLKKGENIDLDIVLENKEKISSGYKSYSEIVGFRDFILSRWKLELFKKEWWPVNISSSSIDESQDGNGLFAVSFEISSQHSQEQFFDN